MACAGIVTPSTNRSCTLVCVQSGIVFICHILMCIPSVNAQFMYQVLMCAPSVNVCSDVLAFTADGRSVC